jgi:predicted phosphohydrolase
VRIWVLNDLHTEFAPFVAPAVSADVLVAAGDIGIGVNGLEFLLGLAPLPVVYVAGNHEYYRGAIPHLTFKLRDRCEGTNVKFLENDSVELQGVRFAGCTLWTDFELLGSEQRPMAMEEARSRMTDFRLIRRSPEYRRFSPADSALIHRKSRAWLGKVMAASSERLVIVTHHAPHKLCVREEYRAQEMSAAYASDLMEELESGRAAAWIHGHTHYCVDQVIGKTRVISNQRGYPGEGIKGFRPDFVFEI